MVGRLGFIGLGAMGLPMTRVLAGAGYTVAAFDADGATLEKAVRIDGVAASISTSAAAADAEILFTCLPNDAVLRAVYLGDQGIAAAMTTGGVTVDCSTVSPGVTREIAEAMAGRSVSHVDAAMLGSVPQAEVGEIGFVVGGDRAAVERVGPLLDILGRFRKYAGPSGSGHQVKLIHQTLVAANAVAVAEAVALCKASDTDLDCFYDVVCNGGGMAYSRYFEKRVPRMREGDFSPLFMLQFMAKDAGLAGDLARDVGLATPLLERVRALFDDAREHGWGGEDFSAVAHLYEPGR